MEVVLPDERNTTRKFEYTNKVKQDVGMGVFRYVESQLSSILDLVYSFRELLPLNVQTHDSGNWFSNIYARFLV